MKSDYEIEIKEDFENRGYKSLRNGHPDFVFFKEDNGELFDIQFVEVKFGKDQLSGKQKTYKRILESLNLNYKLIRKDIERTDTTIRINEETKIMLDKIKIHPRETYDDILKRAIIKLMEKKQ